MEVDGTCTAETSVAFLRHLSTKHPEPLIIMWDNGPAHRGEPLRSYLATPNLNLRLVPLPGYSPDYNADEAIWDWIREDVMANTCLGTKAQVREHVGAFLHGLSARTEEVKRRCRTVLQAQAEALAMTTTALIQAPQHVDPTLALV
jgi:transposase